MILLIDNYDSFTYNLYQMLSEITPEIRVLRNDAITLEEIAALDPNGIVLSPGPGRPEEAGICIPLIQRFAKDIPILGVCLGHQAIACALGGLVTKAPDIAHGKASFVYHCNQHLMKNMPQPFKAARYHSLCIDREHLPHDLIITAEDKKGLIMAVKHQHYPCYGVQFHPESIITESGKTLLNNFIQICEETSERPC